MKRCAVVFFAGIMVVLGLAVPASADDSRCPSNSFCLFQDVNYGGQRVVFNRIGYAYCNLGDFGFNNKASSMINNTGRRVVLHQYVNCGGGQTYGAAPNSVDSSLSNNNFNDKASAVIIP